MAECLEAAAPVAFALYEPERAARLGAAAASLRNAMGAPLPYPQRDAFRRLKAGLEAALGRRFDAVWSEGKTLDLDRTADLIFE
jgi:hypothetical protein